MTSRTNKCYLIMVIPAFDQLLGLVLELSNREPVTRRTVTEAMWVSRRIASPDSLVICHLNADSETHAEASLDALKLLTNAVALPFIEPVPTEAECIPARKLAQQMLKECAMNRDTFARGSANVSLFCAARIEAGGV